MMMSLLLFFNPLIAGVIVGIFFMVLLHEFGHCIAAQHYDVSIKDITLFPFGGAAQMQIPWDAIQELVIALSGPLVNVLLIVPLYFASQWHQFFETMFFYNIVLIVFNMIPAFPMDGGRVMRSLLNLIWNDHYRATLWAVRVGQIFSILFVILGILGGNINLSIIGVFIFFSARQELEVSRMQSLTESLVSTLQGHRAEIAAATESISMLRDIQFRMGDIDRRYNDSN